MNLQQIISQNVNDSLQNSRVQKPLAKHHLQSCRNPSTNYIGDYAFDNCKRGTMNAYSLSIEIECFQQTELSIICLMCPDPMYIGFNAFCKYDILIRITIDNILNIPDFMCFVEETIPSCI